MRLRQESQALVRHWQTEQSGWVERLKALEQENQRLQEEANMLQQQSQSQLAQLQQPDLNAPIYDIFSREFTQRSGDQSGVNRIKIPPTARNLILLLNGQGQQEFPAYAIELKNPNGQVIWRGDGLARDPNGNFVVTLNRMFVQPQKYTLTIYGQRGGRARRIAEYIISFD